MARTLTYCEAINEATIQGMEQDPNVFVFGLGADDYKGIFGTTRGAFEKFGEKRVFDVPCSENALTGMAIGAALNGKRSILVHARNDFMFLTLDQMLNNAAKWKYTYAGKTTVPFVTRGIIGKGWGQGPTHSQSLQSIFAHFPGLIVTMPSNAYDIKGVILKSLQVDSPTVILEHRSLYDLKTEVPENPYTIEFGQARIVREGKDLTLVATSWYVPEAVKAADILAKEGIEVEVIDPITIQPLDRRSIVQSIKKTGRLIVADTSWAHCGFAAEVAAVAAEEALTFLKTPVKRITPPACPGPVSQTMEEVYYNDYVTIANTAFEMMESNTRFSGEKEEVVIDTFAGPY